MGLKKKKKKKKKKKDVPVEVISLQVTHGGVSIMAVGRRP